MDNDEPLTKRITTIRRLSQYEKKSVETEKRAPVNISVETCLSEREEAHNRQQCR